jgi:sugar phosphate isomerase/epimerase
VIDVRDVGIALKVPAGSFPFRGLEAGLAAVRGMGFALVEIGPAPFTVILDGEIQPRQLGSLLAVVRSSGLRFSVHGLGRLNLAYDPRHDLCRRIMRAQIELCRAVGASRLVYHSGLQALDGVRTGLCRTLLSAEELEEGARREAAALRELGRSAADAGVVIAVENLDPHSWEHQLIRQFDLPASDIDRHLARLRIGPIVRQLEAIDHPNVGMTFDIGHLYLAAHDLGFPFLEAVSEAAPWVRHIHLSDNFGRLDVGYPDEMERRPYGEADLHLPPGWGSIPFRDVLALLPDYRGDIILEIEQGFEGSLAEARSTVRGILAAPGRNPKVRDLIARVHRREARRPDP